MEPSFIEYLIKQTLLRPDRMIEAFSVLLALMVLLILVAIFRRPKRKPLPVFQMPEASAANAPSGVRKDLFSQSIPTRSAQAGSHMNMAELLDIEEALLALRELYHRKLISANVYVDESMKHSTRLMR
ncbi:MAG: hypothetical protein RI902_900 [Pseudomonadota bacterium]|jgi:hypothetical protein